jgi:hypothetical protein
MVSAALITTWCLSSDKSGSLWINEMRDAAVDEDLGSEAIPRVVGGEKNVALVISSAVPCRKGRVRVIMAAISSGLRALRERI